MKALRASPLSDCVLASLLQARILSFCDGAGAVASGVAVEAGVTDGVGDVAGAADAVGAEPEVLPPFFRQPLMKVWYWFFGIFCA